MTDLLFTLDIVAPIFLLIFLGMILKTKSLLTDSFTACATSLIYKIALPVMVFLSIARADFHSFFDVSMVLVLYGSALVLFLILWIVTPLLISDPKDRGVFQQGSLRGNYAIVGFAVIQSLYGEQGLAKAAILLAFILPLNNILAIISLSAGGSGEKSLMKQFAETLLHPLILSVVVAVPFSLLRIQLPPVVVKTGGYLSSMVLPLALLAIGASLQFKTSRADAVLTGTASFLKLLIFPGIQLFTAYLLHFRGEDLGVLVILWSVPTAVVSYIMAEGMNSNGRLAAAIVAISTVFSIITMSGFIILGRSTGLY
ncbi:AEC family transporter [bacterium]|nr:AEC family transporter [bacterium]